MQHRFTIDSGDLVSIYVFGFLALNLRTLLQDFGTIEDGFAWWEQR